MRSSPPLTAVALLGWVAFACAAPTPSSDGGSTVDSGIRPDSGTLGDDAGHHIGRTDAGSVDAGPGDAGTPDAGINHPHRDGGAAQFPAQWLNLQAWKLTLPVETAQAGNPDEIKQPQLATFSDATYFHVNDARDGVVFQAPCGGATTGGSSYPRSELREMETDGVSQASWSTTSGTHTMIIRQAITHLPEKKPHVVAGQIHDASDDVIMIRLEGSRLFVEAGGNDKGVLNANYSLGTPFEVKIVANGGRIKVYYEGLLKVDLAQSATGCYFKAGVYTQSNVSRGDLPSAYGEVVVYDLWVGHE